MSEVIRAAPLYTFLWYCNQSALEKVVLDCGAGGSHPPLSLFFDCGYKTLGIEISDRRRMMANRFAEERGMDLHIRPGDIRQIPLPDQASSFAYCFNTIFHLRKAEIAKAVGEIHRVLVPGGLYFINFLSVDDGDYGAGQEIAPGEFRQQEDENETIHTYMQDGEPDAYFVGDTVLRKEKRIVDVLHAGEKHRMAFIDVIAQKTALP